MIGNDIAEKQYNSPSTKKHGRSSSSDQPAGKPLSTSAVMASVEQDEEDLRAIPSPSRTQSRTSDRPKSKRPKSLTSAASHRSSRPTYSRRYSTPPSRPLSPSGYPQLLESEGMIPEMDLNVTGPYEYQSVQEPSSYCTLVPQQYYDLSVDTAPQEPDIWEDPETDYFSTVEGPAKKHNRAKSRRQLSQNPNGFRQLELGAKGLQQITEDSEFLLPPTPGAFAV